jgi:hypothetical protein
MWNPLVVIALGVLALADLGVALSFRARLVQASEERPRTNPKNALALGQWRVGTIMSFAFAENDRSFRIPSKDARRGWEGGRRFFALGLLLMLLWTPHPDLPSMNQ